MPVAISGKTSAYDEQLISANQVVTLTDATTISVNLNVGPNYQVTITANRTLGNPTGTSKTKVLWLLVKQDGTGGHTLAFDTNWIAVDSTTDINVDPDGISLIRAFERDFGSGAKWYYTVEQVNETGGGGATLSPTDDTVVGALNGYLTTALSEYILGGFSFNPTDYNATTISLRLVGNFTTTDVSGSFELRLYDMGTGATVFAPVRRATVSVPYADKDKQVYVDQQLAITASPGVNLNEIYDTERVYELRAYLNVSSGSTNGTVSWGGLKLTGTGGAPGPFELGIANSTIVTTLNEESIGGFYFDPELYDISYTVLRLIGMFTSTDNTSSFQVRLYDMGDGTGAFTPVRRATVNIAYADRDKYLKVDQVLTLVASPGVNLNEIHSVARSYEVRLYINASSGSPIGYSAWAGISAEGNRPPANPVVLRPAQITSNQTDWLPSGFTSKINTIYVNSDADRILNSINATGFSDGQTLVINNNGSYTITLKHDDNSTGTAGYRFILPSSKDFNLYSNSTAILLRDNTSVRWKVFTASPDLVDSLQAGLYLSPVMLYPLDPIIGNALDFSGNSRTLTPTGSILNRSSPVIGAMSSGFTGVGGQYFSVSGASMPPVMLGAASALIAVQPNGTGTYWIISAGGVGGTASSADNINWALELVSGNIRFHSESGTRSAATVSNANYSGAVSNGQWSVFAFTRNSAGTGVKLFINGAKVEDTTTTAPTTTGDYANIIIGIKPGGTEPLNANICAAHVYDYELSESNILTLSRKILKQVGN